MQLPVARRNDVLERRASEGLHVYAMRQGIVRHEPGGSLICCSCRLSLHKNAKVCIKSRAYQPPGNLRAPGIYRLRGPQVCRVPLSRGTQSEEPMSFGLVDT